jgi:hypothetical protein
MYEPPVNPIMLCVAIYYQIEITVMYSIFSNVNFIVLVHAVMCLIQRVMSLQSAGRCNSCVYFITMTHWFWG